MEYILDGTGAIDFVRYGAYLSSIRGQIPEHVYAFASDVTHFNSDSRSSLHDAWLESLTIRENATGERRQVRRLEIHLCLLGPCHDRRIHLDYSEVIRYSFMFSQRDVEARSLGIGHGDLLSHEVRVANDALLVHELAFESGATLLIECADIRHTEEPIE